VANNIRVYELARELGMTNAQVIELCGTLGIGVKGHSSGMPEPQADRVRRKAEREGLVNEVKEEKPAAKKPAAKKPAAKKPAAKESVAKESTAKKVEDTEEASTKESSQETSEQKSKSEKTERPVQKIEEKEEKPSQPADTGTKNTTPPLSSTGKPIPPPPTSRSGKPIPPPPGQGGRRQPPPAGGPSGRRNTPPPTATPRRPAPSGGPRESVPGAGVRPDMGPGGPQNTGKPGGGPGGGRRPPRGKKRRRRVQEELEPLDAPNYTPEDAAVPEGEVLIERPTTAQELGPKLNRTAADVVRFLMQQGEMVTATQSLSDDMIELFAVEIGAEIRLVDLGEEQEVELLKLLEVSEDQEDSEAPIRPPIITVMGHVDHGKTKLLDQIRKTNVADGETGGITQHIGAYQVELDGHPLTFIDTPGHEAFTEMRARGADATDIVVLVVAADDGVMPQTAEAISHAKAAEVPIVVAINKIDRENADVQRTMTQIAENELVPEAWGGDTVTVEISALQDLGIDDLLENLKVLAEVEDLRASPEGRAQGVVLESNLDIGRGPVATILVQRGTLNIGDPLVAGAAWGKVRAMVNDLGEQVQEAGPSTPVQVLGLSDVADAGEGFVVAPNERIAGRVAESREHWKRQTTMSRDSHALSGGARLEDIFEQIQRGEAANLNLIVKADVNGSLEAVVESLRKLEREEVRLSFVHRGVGGITKNDIQLAAATNATIIGFNVRPERIAREFAVTEQVEIRTYEIIYKLIEDIEAAMVGMLTPEFEEIVTGDAEVREIFSIPRIGRVAGCYVQNGLISRGSKVRFLRDGSIIWKGEISSLRRFKEDVAEVQTGFECGIGLSDFQDLKQGDVIETYDEREIPRT